jgi:hypothetical protein
MADAVQRELEGMVEELEDLEDRGLLSRGEVVQVVARRRDSEYLLARRAPRKEDFLRYIESEVALDKLRAKRKTRKGVQASGVGDARGRRRVHRIYERAVRRFKGDLELWHAAIEFALKHKAHDVASKRLGEAVKLHPRHVAFWVEAARFHLRVNRDVATARALMQTALRVNSHSHALWGEYLRLEALYLLQLRQRREALGIDEAGADAAQGAAAASADGADGDAEVDAEGGDADADADADADPDPDPDARRTALLFKGTVLRIVIAKAVAALPHEVELRVALASAMASFFGTSVSALALELSREVWRDATEGPSAPSAGADVRERCWAERARFELAQAAVAGGRSPLEAESDALKLLRRAVAAQPTPTMYHALADFAATRLEQGLEQGSADQTALPEDGAKSRKRPAARRGAQQSQSDEQGLLLSEQTREVVLRDQLRAIIAEDQARAVQLEERTLVLVARACAADADVVLRCLELCPTSAALCTLALRAQGAGAAHAPAAPKRRAAKAPASASASDSPHDRRRALVERTLGAWLLAGHGRKVDEVLDLHLELLEHIVNDTALPDSAVEEAFLRSARWFLEHGRVLGKEAAYASIAAVQRALLAWSASAGPAALDAVFVRVERAGVPPVLPKVTFETMLELRGAQDDAPAQVLRALLTKACTAHPREADLWTRLVRFERARGGVANEKAALLRAMQSVPDRDAFLAAL